MSLRLRMFINTLEREGIFTFNVNNFDSRLRLQKYVYIARVFGEDLGYTYGLYIHGPYSTRLAHDYYNLNTTSSPRCSELNPDFIELVNNKGSKWLEYASTMILFYLENPVASQDDLIGRVLGVKPDASIHFLRRIARELSEYNLI